MKSFFICFLIYDINIYIIMTIKSSQTLVSEALKEIKTISMLLMNLKKLKNNILFKILLKTEL